MVQHQERRRHARYRFGFHLEVRGPAPIGKMLVRARDISERGFCFATEVSLQVGDQIELGLRSDPDVVAAATVRNVRREAGWYVVGAELSEPGELSDRPGPLDGGRPQPPGVGRH
jgi:hypothetical protein